MLGKTFVLTRSDVSYPMEPTRAKPVKKRPSCWLIVALLVSGVSWWYWPRIDQSLVGKWHLSTSDPRISGAFWLNADGTGQAVVREPRGISLIVVSRVFNWRVEGNGLAVLRPIQSGIRWWDTAMGRAYDFTKNPVFLGRDRYGMTRDNAGTVQMTGSPAISRTKNGLPAVFSLTRILK
jgi:hypothetical protein